MLEYNRVMDDIESFRRRKWRFESDDTWLVFLNDKEEPIYFIDILTISKIAFIGCLKINVVEYSTKNVVPLTYIQKYRLFKTVFNCLGSIKMSIINDKMTTKISEHKKRNDFIATASTTTSVFETQKQKNIKRLKNMSIQEKQNLYKRVVDLREQRKKEKNVTREEILRQEFDRKLEAERERITRLIGLSKKK